MITAASRSWFLGLDLGQRQDFTAIATISCEWTPLPKLVLHEIHRFPLGTSYLFYPTAIRARHREIHTADSSASATLAIDAAGPGAPIVEELRATLPGLAVRPYLITGGRRPSPPSSGVSTVPRRLLISNLVSLIETRRIAAPLRVRQWRSLLAELLALRAATTHPARRAAHDDMVLALALAAWQAVRDTPGILRLEKQSGYGRRSSHFFRKSEPVARSHDP